ncbi:MAG: ribonuclease III, partial [Coriobacteriia bacterium]|nr:ribonuclease III [Coriobacteriia bacterium]
SAVEADPQFSYERLEFLGDAIVDLIVAQEAYERFPDVNEGTLTKIRISVVNGTILTEVATELGIDKLIIFGQSEKSSQNRGIRSATGDVFEALTAALYLDAGIEEARRWVLQNLGDYINTETAQAAASPKSQLQELMQAQGKTVSYRIIEETGPAHAPSFISEVLIDEVSVASGSGETKKQAEAAAASEALEHTKDQ